MVGGKAEQTEGGEMGVTAITDHTRILRMQSNN